MSIAERREPAELHASVRAFVDDVVLPSVAEWDRADELPDGALARLVDLGLTGALVPAQYGGAGLGVSDLWPAWRVLSQGWISLTGAINPTNLATTLLVRHGTEAQRARWLPGIARGEVRSEERRVGKECRCRWSPCAESKKSCRVSGVE